MNKVTTEDLMKLSHKDIVRFALFCAYQIEDRWNKYDLELQVIKQVELWLEDKASTEECVQLAHGNTDFVVRHTAYTVCVYTYLRANAIYAINAAEEARVRSMDNRDEIVKRQINYYNELRYLDDILEDAILKA